jgi:hypothetical protein
MTACAKMKNEIELQGSQSSLIVLPICKSITSSCKRDCLAVALETRHEVITNNTIRSKIKITRSPSVP